MSTWTIKKQRHRIFYLEWEFVTAQRLFFDSDSEESSSEEEEECNNLEFHFPQDDLIDSHEQSLKSLDRGFRLK